MPESERELWVAKHERELFRCPRCGQPRETCSDAERTWFPQRAVCYAELESRGTERLYEALHKDRPFHDGSFASWAGEPSRSHPYHFSDGVSIWVAPADLDPDDKFTTDPNATPRGGESDGHAPRKSDR